ncbi:MAG: multiheme c-type cytochrome [Acidobacteriota bacterium]
MSFRSVFISIFIGTSLILAAFILHQRRPPQEADQPSPQFVQATGKCAECHLKETSAVVHQYERSEHARANVTCFDCHRAAEGQQEKEHDGFLLAVQLTSLNCQRCHTTEYAQYARSRHALPAWAAIKGTEGMSAEMIAFGESYHAGAVDRAANALGLREGAAATQAGCLGCHGIGTPNQDGSIGTCTDCHSRHSTSIALAREPQTCGQCHMGPDHAQIEIYNESKHGVLYQAQKRQMNLTAEPKRLSTRDMPVPTCATCHMSGLEGLKVTHDLTERLSYWLFAAVSKKRPGYQQGQTQMKEVCLKCHASPSVERFYAEAETVLATTNEKVEEGQRIIAALRQEGLLTPAPFDEPIEFVAFDFWHYYGRTAKHGAFMGGADFVQWHGNYELLAKLTELEEMAAALRRQHEGE